MANALSNRQFYVLVEFVKERRDVFGQATSWGNALEMVKARLAAEKMTIPVTRNSLKDAFQEAGLKTRAHKEGNPMVARKVVHSIVSSLHNLYVAVGQLPPPELVELLSRVSK